MQEGEEVTDRRGNTWMRVPRSDFNCDKCSARAQWRRISNAGRISRLCAAHGSAEGLEVQGVKADFNV